MSRWRRQLNRRHRQARRAAHLRALFAQLCADYDRRTALLDTLRQGLGL